MTRRRTVFVVDDDAEALCSTRYLLESAGYAVETYASGSDFLKDYDPTRLGCLVLDIAMPGMNGMELQKNLLGRGQCPPTVFLTGHGDVPLCSEAMKRGAIDFIEKPATANQLLSCVRKALDADSRASHPNELSQESKERIRGLTSREREVMELLFDGMTQKRIAAKFGITFQTVAKHRARVLEKLEVTNDTELVHLLLGREIAPR